MRSISHLGTGIQSSLSNAYDPTGPTLTIVYGPSQFGWNLPTTGSTLFSKTLLKTRSPTWYACCLTHLLYKFVVLCWYDVIRIVAASRSKFTISRSLVRALVLASSEISVRSVGIPIFVGIMASIL